MKKVSILLVCILFLSLSTSLVAQAQTNSENQQQYAVKVGPYNFIVTIYSQLIKTATDVPFSVAFDPKNSLPIFNNKSTTLTLEAEPGRNTSASPIKIQVSPDASDPLRWTGKMNIGISGNWSLKIAADGLGGKAEGSQNFVVAPPPALPEWLAWLIGLTPAFWFLVFFVVQYIQNRKKIKAELAY